MSAVLGRPATIFIPASGNFEKLQVCLESLIRHVPDECSIYVLDGTSDDGLRSICQQTHDRVQCRRLPERLKFEKACNWGVEHLWRPGSDLLLLSHETTVTEGFLEEMQAVLHLHEKHGMVVPRATSGAAISVPVTGESPSKEEAFHIWNQIRDLLPRYQVIPTAPLFCMLIRSEILERFGLFDEHDVFISRMDRFGNSLIAANRAFVFCDGTETVPEDSEHARALDDYLRVRVDPLERFAGLLQPHKPRLLYDLFHLGPLHHGTSEFGLSVLRELRPLIDDFELHVGITCESLDFFAAELAGHRICLREPETATVFDLLFKPSQVFTWDEFRRMNRLAPRLSYTLQDIIGIRCSYLNSAEREIVIRNVAELSDHTFTISRFTQFDFAAFYNIDTAMQVIYHGTNFWEPLTGGDYVLVVGNAYTHKGVSEALEELGESWPVVVLGSLADTSRSPAHARHFASGQLSRQDVRELFAKARILVYPSYYEGFGLPVTDALALHKPVVLLDSAVSREIAELTGNLNLHRVTSARHLKQKVQELFDNPEYVPGPPPRSWHAVATEYATALREIISRDVDWNKLRARWSLLRAVESAQKSPQMQ